VINYSNVAPIEYTWRYIIFSYLFFYINRNIIRFVIIAVKLGDY